MGWSFRKRIKVAPGIHINLSKSGVSTSIGGKGFTYNSRGRVTASIPGTGIRYSQSLNSKRASSPVKSVVAGSGRIDPATTERLSKREQATREFVAMVQARTSTALVQYFTSYGVHVEVGDLSEAVTLDEHQPFLETLSQEFEVTTKVIRLAVDIGSISLAEKERAMLAVYEIERGCTEHQGTHGELEAASSSLQRRVQEWPKSPGFVAPFLAGFLGCFVLARSLPTGLVLVGLALAYGGYRTAMFIRRKAAAAAAIAEANEWFDSLVTVEVTPRSAVAAGKDYVSQKAIGFGAVILAAATYALVASPHQSNSQEDVPAQASSMAMSIPAAGTSATRADVSRSGGDLSWLVGKNPSDIVNDRRFRAAFSGLSRIDWERAAERLAVTNSSGIERKDGYLFGQGCKAHSCSSDQAAFAINEATGKGDLVLSETLSSSSNAVVRTYQWRELPLSETPLFAWARETGVNLAPQVAASTRPTVRTSFDCTKARSDAEHIICSDPELAADDVKLAAIYAKAKAVAKDQAAFKARTRAQWNIREQQCHDRQCLARWYADQNAALTEIANTGDVAGL